MWRVVALIALVVSVAAGTATAQRNIGVQPAPGSGGRDGGVYADSWAVVVGVNEYRHERVPKLRYAVADARSIERALLAQGFRRDRIIVLTDGDATKSRIEEALGDRLRRQAGRNDRVLVFFAGHGMTVKIRSGEDEGYLIPVDGDPDRLFSTAISMSALRQISDLIPAKHILYVVDACYSGYAVYNRAVADALFEEMTKKPAIQILTAGRQGDQAQERGGHGVFTDVLIRGLAGEAFSGRSWLALDQLGAWVRERVYAESNKRQIPQFGNLSGDGQFVFLRPGGQVAAAPPPPPPVLEPTITKEIVREYGSVAIRGRVPGAEIWLDGRKLGETESGSALVVNNVAIGTYRVKARKGGYRDWERTVEVASNQRADVMVDLEALGPARTISGDDGAEMVLIPAGAFWMGAEQSEIDTFLASCKTHKDVAHQCEEWGRREMPRHRVTLDAYYIDRYEVTNGRFERFVQATGHRTPAEREGNAWVYQSKDGKWQWVQATGATWRNPSGSGTPAPSNHPVVQMTWHDADAYCRWAGKRLPTEAEWEKAARGTDGRRYPWGSEWSAANANGGMKVSTTSAVGSYPAGASPYGVHDMAGNANEWTADWFDATYYERSPERNPPGPPSGSKRVLRGGSWLGSANVLRTTTRNYDYGLDVRGVNFGFRCAKTP